MNKKYWLWIFLGCVLIFVISRSDFLLNFLASDTSKHSMKSSTEENAGFMGINTIKNFFESAILKILEKNLQEKGFMEQVEQNIFADEKLKIEVHRKGEGNSVFCGQKVLVDIVGFGEDKLNDIEKYENFVMQIGNFALDKQLEWGILGMRKNEIRQISFDAWQDDKLYKKTYKVILKEILEDSNINIDDLILLEQKNGLGMAAMCGDSVKFNFKLRDAKGKEFFSSQILETKLGAKQVPLPIELGLQRSMSKTRRIVISPPSFFQAAFDNLANNFDFIKDISEKEITLIELDVIDVMQYNDCK